MTGQTSLLPLSRDGLAAYLEDQIVHGFWQPGAKLPSERQFAEQFGVSRSVVREVLRSLIERHLVDVLPGRGAYVRDARASDAAGRLDAMLRRSHPTPRDLVEARTMLECAAAGLAAERAADVDLNTLGEALSRFDGAPGVVEQARYDLAFHLAVAHAAHNSVIETMFGAISGLAAEMMLRSLGDPAVARASVPYHRAIHLAIEARDPEGARAAMANHLAVAAKFYGDDFDRGIGGAARRELGRLLAPGVTVDDLLGTPVGGEFQDRDGGDDGRDQA